LTQRSRESRVANRISRELSRIVDVLKEIFRSLHRQFEESTSQFQDAKVAQVAQGQPWGRSRGDEKLAFGEPKKT